MQDAQQIIDYIGITQAALKKAEAEIATRKQAAAEIDKLTADAVDALIDASLIEPRQKEKGIARLSKHASALGLIVQLAGRYKAGAPAAIGKVAGDGDAGKPANDTNRTKRAADNAFVHRMLAVRGR